MIFSNFRAFCFVSIFFLVSISHAQVPTDPTESPTDPITESTTSSSATSSTTSSTTTPAPFTCPTVGGPFPDPSDCKKYHRCTSALVDYVYECPGASYFNELIFKCSIVISPSCQIKLNSTTASPIVPPKKPAQKKGGCIAWYFYCWW